jgi:molybdenum cofactor cytidylyltransferase
VAPFHQGKRGNPVLFDHSIWSEIEQIQGDAGPRAVIEKYQSSLMGVSVQEPAILQDIDTPEDWSSKKQRKI